MFDPFTFWIQGTVMWMKVFKQQQEAYLRLLGACAESLPHENAKTVAREAEAMKKTLKPDAASRKPSARRTRGTDLVSA